MRQTKKDSGISDLALPQTWAIRGDAERKAEWTKEARRLREGDLSTDVLVEKTIDKLVLYMSSRAFLFVPQDTPLSLSLPIVISPCFTPLENIAYRNYNGHACELGFRSTLRDAALTRSRLSCVTDLIRQLNDFSKKSEKAELTNYDARKKEINEVIGFLKKAWTALSKVDNTYGSKHHVHVPGSFFFGHGSLFQSKSQNTVYDAWQNFIQLQSELERVLKGTRGYHNSHSGQEEAFATHVTTLRL